MKTGLDFLWHCHLMSRHADRRDAALMLLRTVQRMSREQVRPDVQHAVRLAYSDVAHVMPYRGSMCYPVRLSPHFDVAQPLSQRTVDRIARALIILSVATVLGPLFLI